MDNWTSTPLTLPASAPEELRQASTRWERTVPSQIKYHSTSTSDDSGANSNIINSASNSSCQALSESSGRGRLIDSIIEDVFDKQAAINEDTVIQASVGEQTQPLKRKRMEDSSLDAALARLYPPKQLHHVKIAHITDGNQWHPTAPPTQRYSSCMKQPLDRALRWDDDGLLAQTKGRVPHETVLNYFVDVMRNKHWRGPINNMISSIPTKALDPWPRTHYPHITRMIASNPFLLRLSQMLEGRFHEAACRNLEYVPAVAVHGYANQNVPLQPHYIAAILVQALGRENALSCSLCAGEWNKPTNTNTNRASAEDTETDAEMRPFQTCVSLYSIALPARFAACGNHFWQASITDCACVDLNTSLHADERWQYIYDTFSHRAANYMFVKNQLRHHRR